MILYIYNMIYIYIHHARTGWLVLKPTETSSHVDAWCLSAGKEAPSSSGGGWDRWFSCVSH